jgi:hypothetical protein
MNPSLGAISAQSVLNFNLHQTKGFLPTRLRKNLNLVTCSAVGDWGLTAYTEGLEATGSKPLNSCSWEHQKMLHHYNSISVWLPRINIQQPTSTQWILKGPDNTWLAPNYYKSNSEVKIRLSYQPTTSKKEESVFSEDTFTTKAYVDPNKGSQIVMEETIAPNGITGDGLDWSLKLLFNEDRKLELEARYRTAGWEAELVFRGTYVKL